MEDRLGVRLFERLHKQLVLTPAGRDYVASVRDGFRRIADSTARLKPHGVAAVVTLGVHARFELNRLDPGRFRAVNPTIGLCVVKPAGLHELVEGKISALIDRNLGHHPGYRCDRLETGSGAGDYLVCPEGTANCSENKTLRAWLRRAGARRRVGSLVAVANEI